MEFFRQTHIRDNLKLRSRIFNSVRMFFAESGYIEVETPVLIPAPAPEVHIDALSSGNWYLQTSPELCMKQLLASGYPRIYQICKVFRQNERGKKHLPEFTMLEWYEEGIDYLDMMEICEELILYIARKNGFGETLGYLENVIDLATPWKRLTVKAAFEKYSSISLEEALSKDLFDEVLTGEIEPFLGKDKPLFLYDYPAEKAAFARLNKGAPSFGERFELYMAGLEICNAFSELTDAVLQRERFEQEAMARLRLDKEVYPMPEAFLKALSSMRPAAGNALGLDRLVMIFANSASIDEVVSFIPEEL